MQSKKEDKMSDTIPTELKNYIGQHEISDWTKCEIKSVFLCKKCSQPPQCCNPTTEYAPSKILILHHKAVGDCTVNNWAACFPCKKQVRMKYLPRHAKTTTHQRNQYCTNGEEVLVKGGESKENDAGNDAVVTNQEAENNQEMPWEPEESLDIGDRPGCKKPEQCRKLVGKRVRKCSSGHK